MLKTHLLIKVKLFLVANTMLNIFVFIFLNELNMTVELYILFCWQLIISFFYKLQFFRLFLF